MSSCEEILTDAKVEDCQDYCLRGNYRVKILSKDDLQLITFAFLENGKLFKSKGFGNIGTEVGIDAEVGDILNITCHGWENLTWEE